MSCQGIKDLHCNRGVGCAARTDSIGIFTITEIIGPAASRCPRAIRGSATRFGAIGNTSTLPTARGGSDDFSASRRLNRRPQSLFEPGRPDASMDGVAVHRSIRDATPSPGRPALRRTAPGRRRSRIWSAALRAPGSSRIPYAATGSGCRDRAAANPSAAARW